MPVKSVSDVLGPPSLGVLVDNARTVLVACRDAGVEPDGLLISERDFAEVTRTKGPEVQHGLALRLFGVDLYPKTGLYDGEVELRLRERQR
jgi:hypothetical protein